MSAATAEVVGLEASSDARDSPTRWPRRASRWSLAAAAAAAILREGDAGNIDGDGDAAGAREEAPPGWASRGKSTRGGLAESLRGGDGGGASDAAARGGRAVRGARRVRARRRSRRGGRRHGSASEGAQRNDRRRVDSRRAAADASEGAPRGRDARRWSRGLRLPIARPPTHSRGSRRRVVLRGASNLGGRCVGRLNQTTTYPYARVLLIQRNGRRCANTARSNRARRSRKRNTSIVFETVEREISMRSAVVNSPAESDVSPGGLRF